MNKTELLLITYRGRRGRRGKRGKSKGELRNNLGGRPAESNCSRKYTFLNVGLISNKTRANLIRPLFFTNRMKRELCRFFTLTTYIQHTILGFWWWFGFLVWHWREKAAQTNLFFIPNISVRCYSKSRQENLVVIFF